MPERLVIKTEPYNAESPDAALRTVVTPTSLHYVRSNFSTPEPAEASYRLHAESESGLAAALTLDDLRRLPQHRYIATMECAGNDRLGMRPLPEGEPWASGAVSTATWQGVRLLDVLDAALPGAAADPLACELLVEGADQGRRHDAIDANSTPEGGSVRFARSIPLDMLRHPDTMLALSMNDAPLTPSHGAPVRLVVPGWYGMANVKWVTRLRVIRAPFTGYFQSRRYIYDSGSDVTPVSRMRVKSILTSPAEGALIPLVPTVLHGWAWSGAGPIARVEVAIGGGDRWMDATLGQAEHLHAWTPWTFAWSAVESGRVTIRTRATDATGATQPDQIEWNRLGYGNNAVRQFVMQVLPAEAEFAGSTVA